MKIIDDLKSEVSLPAGKDKTMYIVLAIFLGGIGVHNLWAGNNDKGMAQLIVGLVGSICCGIGPLISWITAIMDVMKVSK